MHLSKILLPVDFSEQSLGAARYAGMLACRYQSELTMLHVVAKNDYPLVDMEVPVDLRDWWKAHVVAAQKKLDSFLTGRGRDSDCSLPPAQTRAGATSAHGSYLGCWDVWRRSARRGRGA